MNSVSDRPHALLSEAQLETRIAGNQSQQSVLEKLRTRAVQYQLTQLKRACAELIAERNLRADMQEIPW